MAIASAIVAAVILLMAAGSAYATIRGFRTGNFCDSCGGACGHRRANPINVSFDEKQ